MLKKHELKYQNNNNVSTQSYLNSSHNKQKNKDYTEVNDKIQQKKQKPEKKIQK